jgi:hypothetical protein
MNRRRVHSMIALAALTALAGMPLYANKPGDPPADGGAGGGSGSGGKPPETQATKLELTEQELHERTNAAVKSALDAERKKRDSDDAKTREEAERKKAEEQGEFQKIAAQADEKREKAEKDRDDALRRAQLAEVNVQLRDYLAHDDRKAFLANAPDIMLHVEKELPADAKPEDVAKLIEKKTAEFIARTAPTKGGAHGAPAGGARGKLPAGQVIPPAANPPRSNGETRRQPGTAGLRF